MLWWRKMAICNFENSAPAESLEPPPKLIKFWDPAFNSCPCHFKSEQMKIRD